MPPPTTDTDFHFPKAGTDRSVAFGKQPARQLPNGTYARTTRRGVNVRAYEPGTLRDRGGARPGLVKYLKTKAAGTTFVVQELAAFATVSSTGPGGVVPQTSQSSRVVNLTAVSLGNVYSTVPGGTAWTAATNNSGASPPLNQSGVLFSSPLNQRLYFADGVNWRYFDPGTNSVETWAASTAGTLPVDADGKKPRLICTWQARIVVAGWLGMPFNWAMSRVYDAHDWDYSPASPDDPTRAVIGNNSAAGQIGDVVTALVPFTDDILYFGGDHTIHRLSGNPAEGGRVDAVSSTIGIVWGQAYTFDPDGTIYFMSNQGPVYRLVPPNGKPERISVPVDPLLRGVNTGETVVRLLWNDRYQGLHLFLTPAAEPAATTHYFWEARTGAWWQDEFANELHDPLCCCVLDGNEPDDRVALVGCWDGFVRALLPDARDDDGYPIESEVWLGPVVTPEQDDVIVTELQAALAEASGAVSYEVFVGRTAEAAAASEAVASGTWDAGRNHVSPVRRSGHAVYVRLFSDEPWAMESVRLRAAATGMVRRRMT